MQFTHRNFYCYFNPYSPEHFFQTFSKWGCFNPWIFLKPYTPIFATIIYVAMGNPISIDTKISTNHLHTCEWVFSRTWKKLGKGLVQPLSGELGLNGNLTQPYDVFFITSEFQGTQHIILEWFARKVHSMSYSYGLLNFFFTEHVGTGYNSLAGDI